MQDKELGMLLKRWTFIKECHLHLRYLYTESKVALFKMEDFLKMYLNYWKKMITNWKVEYISFILLLSLSANLPWVKRHDSSRMQMTDAFSFFHVRSLYSLVNHESDRRYNQISQVITETFEKPGICDYVTCIQSIIGWHEVGVRSVEISGLAKIS